MASRELGRSDLLAPVSVAKYGREANISFLIFPNISLKLVFSFVAFTDGLNDYLEKKN